MTPVWALYWLAFTLGLRHGFDPDHLTVIDGIARSNAHRNIPLARASGFLFSLGHGVVVVAVALGDALFASRWRPPSWLEVSGVLVSVAVLLGLGVINLRTLAVASPTTAVVPRGFRAQFLLRALHVHDPFLVAVAGMIFAISIDTLVLAALFAALSVGQGGLIQVLITALAFTAGMALLDGINGVLFTTLVRRSDQARLASRIVTGAVAGLSIVLGIGILLGLLVPGVAAWVGGNSLWLGIAIVGLTCACFWLVSARA